MDIQDAGLLDEFESSRDEAAFRRLYRSHTPRLYALAMRLTGGSGGDSEELVQQAWVRAIERLDRFQRRSSFRTWLSGILVNCYRELSRRRVRTPATLEQLPEEASRPTVAPFPRPRLRADPIDVERAIARLASGYREVVVLYDLNGYSHHEIAELLGISPGTSKSQLARGRARLRELLLAGPRKHPASGVERGKP